MPALPPLTTVSSFPTFHNFYLILPILTKISHKTLKPIPNEVSPSDLSTIEYDNFEDLSV